MAQALLCLGCGDGTEAALIEQTPGTIGYVEYGYAENNKQPMAVLQNQAGKFVAPTPESGSAALAQVPLPDNLRAFITDPAGDNLGQANRISDQLAYFFVERDKQSRFARPLEFGPTKQLTSNPKSESLKSYLSGKIG